MNIIDSTCVNPYCECVAEQVTCRNLKLFNDPKALDYVVGDTCAPRCNSIQSRIGGAFFCTLTEGHEGEHNFLPPGSY